MLFHFGTYVVHKKLAELGSGEIIKAELGAITIRFASGTRNFSESHVGKHLETTSEAPVLPPPPTRRSAKKRTA